ncbi:hypothetical protein [Nocardia wallacei]|uniref:hypothetical protein n=1 Tax=Nocardia wallacei TaxID=480035 RepID=UPI0024581A0C|nr:hypothetical protein [Nocardia wallacei]
MKLWRSSPRAGGSKAELVQRVRHARLSPAVEAQAIRRPATVGTFYLEEEFDYRGKQQHDLNVADGEDAALKASSQAAGLEAARTESLYLVKSNRPMVDTALRHYLKVKEVLSPLAVRHGSSAGYTLRVWGLLVGDIAGLGGAGIAYGELPALALAQAASAGIATITAGLSGGQLRVLVLAKERQFDTDKVSPELRPYLPVLIGAGRSSKFVMAVTAVSAVIALFIAVGIFSLRSGIEGLAAGITFGALAIAIASASWVNSYVHADPVADIIEGARRGYASEQRAHRRLTLSPWLVLAERAIERAKVIRRKHQELGHAAIAYFQALKHQVLSENPSVVGHGYEVAPPAAQRAIKGKRL